MTRIALGPGVEFDLIRSFLAEDVVQLHPAVRVGPGDDCAVVSGEGIALSVDIMVEDVHFRREWLTPEEIGYRAATAALSDLAAVAAQPIGVLVSLAVEAGAAAGTAPSVMHGVRSAARAVGAALLGGDMSRIDGPLVIDVVAVGSAPRPVLRSGARAGDSLWVTGTLGGAAAAVRAWNGGVLPDAAARTAFVAPRARTAEAQWLAARGVLHALIDLSDGLASDACHIAAASDVRIVLDAAAVPVHGSVRAAVAEQDALRLALAGGEDYELCFSSAPGAIERLAQSFVDTFDVPITRVGSVEPGAGVLLRTAAGVAELPWSGHDHFAPQSR